MLRTRAVEVSLWEAVLPEEVLRLPEELARVDALLDDPLFFAPFVPFFDPRLGRPYRQAAPRREVEEISPRQASWHRPGQLPGFRGLRIGRESTAADIVSFPGNRVV